MAAGCLMLASDTQPVREVIADGANGLLCDFHAPDDIANRAIAALADPAAYAALRARARETVHERYDHADCLARHTAKVLAMAG